MGSRKLSGCGEGPVWVERDRALWFTDIKRQKIYRFDTETGEQREWDTMEGTILAAEERLERAKRATEDPAIAADAGALQQCFAELSAAQPSKRASMNHSM